MNCRGGVSSAKFCDLLPFSEHHFVGLKTAALLSLVWHRRTPTSRSSTALSHAKDFYAGASKPMCGYFSRRPACPVNEGFQSTRFFRPRNGVKNNLQPLSPKTQTSHKSLRCSYRSGGARIFHDPKPDDQVTKATRHDRHVGGLVRAPPRSDRDDDIPAFALRFCATPSFKRGSPFSAPENHRRSFVILEPVC